MIKRVYASLAKISLIKVSDSHFWLGDKTHKSFKLKGYYSTRITFLKEYLSADVC